jgi:ketosteroid isomerase-like protein
MGVNLIFNQKLGGFIMKKLTGLFLLVSLLFPINTGLVAQEWTDAQKEVWKNIEVFYELSAKRDIPGCLSFFHDDFSGWHYTNVLPTGKEARKKVIEHYFPKSKVFLYELQPVDIKVHDNVAIVHYLLLSVVKDEEDKEEFRQSRWTDILLKENDKWLTIGDHGGLIKVK